MRMVSEWLRGECILPPNALAVTVDDGYADFEETGYPVFAEYQIPVTVFLVTDFLDGKSWLWFDRVVYAFRHATICEPEIAMPGAEPMRFNLESDATRRAAGQRVADRAVDLSVAARADLLAALPRFLQAEIPEQPPPEYGPLAWDTVRALAGRGVEFGAHTESHPILSAVSSHEELWREIAGCKARIEAELDRPVLHFCYPNGKTQDIGAAAARMVQEAGMKTAVTAEPGINTADQDAFLLNRIAADPSHPEMYFSRSVARGHG